jgi:hypothetical protein
MASLRRLDQWFASASHAVQHHRRRRRPVLEALEGRLVLSTFTVNSLADARTGSNNAGDLRYCINQDNANQANPNDGANQIVFDPTVFGTPHKITLGGGPLELEDTGGTQTITGPAAGMSISNSGNGRAFQVDITLGGVPHELEAPGEHVTIKGSGNGCDFQVDDGVTASISGRTISGGSISSV